MRHVCNTFEALLEEDLAGREEEQRREDEEAAAQAAAAAGTHRRRRSGEEGELGCCSGERAELLGWAKGNICSARGSRSDPRCWFNS